MKNDQENIKGIDLFEEVAKIYIEDEKYVLSRYEVTEQNLYIKVWKEIFENSLVFNDENLKMKMWKDVFLDTSRIQLKIIDKLSQEYVGEVAVMQLDTDTPELGI